MKPSEKPKVLSPAALAGELEGERTAGRSIVFTNGCFDVLHVGHVRLLQAAKDQGDVLVVAVNDDESVKRQNKGDDRPVHPLPDRTELLAAFAMVDYVTWFAEDTPADLIATIQPDVLVKGGDWGADRIVGRDVVEARGGRVVRVPLVAGRSTSTTLGRIRNNEN